jgi:hypothetical protein
LDDLKGKARQIKEGQIMIKNELGLQEPLMTDVEKNVK